MNKIVAVSTLAVLFVATPVFAQTNDFDTSLGYGSSNKSEVTKLQNFLIREGYLEGPATGNYLGMTQKAVAAFQKSHNIAPVSGYFGPATRAAVHASSGTKFNAARINTSVSNATGAAANLSASKVITWQSESFPANTGVNINLLKKVSNKPASYTLLRTLAQNTTNDGQEIWTPKAGETGELYIEVTCASTLVQGCKSNVVRAN